MSKTAPPFKIVMLDDSVRDAALLAHILATHSMNIIHVLNTTEALSEIDTPAVWVVDVFLEGAAGHEVSNGFIRSDIIPRGWPYCRFTGGASEQTLAGLHGFGVFSKSALRATAINQDYIERFVQMIKVAGQSLILP